jgi:hypothetical protein
MAGDFNVAYFYRGLAMNMTRPNPMWTFNEPVMKIFESHPKVLAAVRNLAPCIRTYTNNEFKAPM